LVRHSLLGIAVLSFTGLREGIYNRLTLNCMESGQTGDMHTCTEMVLLLSFFIFIFYLHCMGLQQRGTAEIRYEIGTIIENKVREM